MAIRDIAVATATSEWEWRWRFECWDLEGDWENRDRDLRLDGNGDLKLGRLGIQRGTSCVFSVAIREAMEAGAMAAATWEWNGDGDLSVVTWRRAMATAAL